MMTRIYFVLVFIASLSIVYTVNGQSNKDKLNAEKKQLQVSIEQQKKLLNATQKEKTTSLREIELIKNQIKQQERLISVINEELGLLNHQIEQTDKEISTLSGKLSLLKEEYAKAVYAAYKYRNTFNKSGFILSAKTFVQAAVRMNYLQKYSSLLQQQLLEIEQTKQNIFQKSEQLHKSKAEKSSLALSQTLQKNELDKQRSEKDAIVAKLKTKEKTISSDLKKKVARQNQVDAAIDKIIRAEIAQAQAKANAAKKNATTPAKSNTASTSQANKTTTSAPVQLEMTPEEALLSSDFEGNQGKLPWPVAKGTIINHFGTYSHKEVSSVKITNNGINILTEKDAAIRTVFQGTVAGIIDLNNGSKAVLIRHGNYITVYSNLAAVSVKKNDKVAAKQAIGTVLTMASETYPELHFEVRKNTTPLNPEAWLR
ncbi:MAG: peptidoglycan DD-metalloendopeptidase family protein [Bacteroidales bacterium]|jgi:septal ring factor EnvC (AmiA/AmiB activator)|nr:peptidoglycan DD-metalloendopeptidase family protein [Bacteroidales bacterium]